MEFLGSFIECYCRRYVDMNINTGNLLTSKNIFTKNQVLCKNDILVVITGATIGKVCLFDLCTSEYYLGGDLVKFQVKSDFNPYFVYNFIRSKPVQILIERNITGTTNGHLAPTDIRNLPIPNPPEQKQIEIANHITAIRNQAKQLKQEVKEELERANKEVETMILGNS